MAAQIADGFYLLNTNTLKGFTHGELGMLPPAEFEALHGRQTPTALLAASQ